MSPSIPHTMMYIMSVCPINSDTKFDHLVKAVFAIFLCCKGIYNSLWRNEALKTSCSLQLFTNDSANH